MLLPPKNLYRFLDLSGVGELKVEHIHSPTARITARSNRLPTYHTDLVPRGQRFCLNSIGIPRAQFFALKSGNPSLRGAELPGMVNEVEKGQQ